MDDETEKPRLVVFHIALPAAFLWPVWIVAVCVVLLTGWVLSH